MSTKPGLIIGIAIVSGLLNAFLLGIVFAHGFAPGPCPFPPPGGGPPFARMEHAIGKLEPTDGAKVRAIVEAKQAAMHSDTDKMTGAFPEMDAILTAPKFDEKALEALHNRIEGYDRNMKSDMLDLMLSIAKTLPDQERIEFFKELSPERGGHPGPLPPM